MTKTIPQSKALRAANNKYMREYLQKKKLNIGRREKVLKEISPEALISLVQLDSELGDKNTRL